MLLKPSHNFIGQLVPDDPYDLRECRIPPFGPDESSASPLLAEVTLLQGPLAATQPTEKVFPRPDVWSPNDVLPNGRPGGGGRSDPQHGFENDF